MIKDKLSNAKTYYGLSERLKKGFEWLKSQDLINIECKKYDIDGENIYANVQEYETKDDANYEAHRKYIDIQYMIKGKEMIGVTDISNCIMVEKYDSLCDIEFFSCKQDEQYEVLREGEFLVLFPQDAHKPSIKFDKKQKVKKVVVKVAV